MDERSNADVGFMELILQPEREDAQRRLADRNYWGDTGEWVLSAIVEVERAIHRAPEHSRNCPRCAGNPGQARKCLKRWLKGVIREMEAAHQRFRDEEDDPDGYGSATFNGCLERAREFLEGVDEPSKEDSGSADKPGTPISATFYRLKLLGFVLVVMALLYPWLRDWLNA